MIADLLAVLLAYPQLTKTASNGLIGLGEAIEDSATRAELDAFLAGSLVEETHVRLACLQALQPLDLTDRETSTELWLLCQEVDERNAKLACTIWEENGLEVTDAFLSQFAPYLSAFISLSLQYFGCSQAHRPRVFCDPVLRRSRHRYSYKASPSSRARRAVAPQRYIRGSGARSLSAGSSSRSKRL